MAVDSIKIILVACVVVVTTQNVEESRVVNIPQGPVRGYKNADYDIFEFFGIPYATAPSGTQRFMGPLPASSWTETLDAVDHGIICPQRSDLPYARLKNMTEECLIANVYMPNTEETNLPVLVVVHGGAYFMGFGHELAPRRFANTKKMVTVTFNYRLHAHGFICLGTPEVPGNAGLKDVVAALRWVKDNIAYFGGNPEEVTLSGHSAGASAVDLIMLSKSAEGLFTRVIVESGSNVASWSAHSDPIKSAKDYATLLNFEHVDDLEALEEFYKTVPYDILNSITALTSFDGNLIFSPCIETDLGQEMFINDSAVNIIKANEYRKVPLLYGFTDMEGLLRIYAYDQWFSVMNEHFSWFLPADLEFQSEEERERIAQEIKEVYFGNSRVGILTIFGYINYFTDAVFAYGMQKSARLQIEAGHNQIYLYEYSFNNMYPSVPGVPDALINSPGADHVDQTRAVLDNSLNVVPEEAFTEEYRQMRATMLEMWTNFIITGQPVPEGSSLPAWPPTGAGLVPNMHLGNTIELRHTRISAERVNIWDRVYERHWREPRPPNRINSNAHVIRHSLFLYVVTLFTLLKYYLPN